jgi:ribosomal protein S18 acetylase RimI-like enzyme
MQSLNLNNLALYILLRNELAVEDPYVLQINESEFIERNYEKLCSESTDIFLLQTSEVLGFAELSIDRDTVYIDELYASKMCPNRQTECYTEMLRFLKDYCQRAGAKQLKYTGVNNKISAVAALNSDGYHMTKEHIQMEKVLPIKCESTWTLEKKPLCVFKDMNELFSFMKRCMADSYFAYDMAEVSELVSQNNDLNFIVFERETPIGFVVANINEQRNKQQNQQVVYIEEIAFLKAYRNKGCGKQTLNYVFNEASERQMALARLHVYRHNEAAHALYKKMGFNEVKSIGYWVKACEDKI